MKMVHNRRTQTFTITGVHYTAHLYACKM